MLWERVTGNPELGIRDRSPQGAALWTSAYRKLKSRSSSQAINRGLVYVERPYYIPDCLAFREQLGGNSRLIVIELARRPKRTPRCFAASRSPGSFADQNPVRTQQCRRKRS